MLMWIGVIMYSYIKGRVVDLESNHIVVDNNGIGYQIYVSNPYEFKRNEELLLYVYQQVKEDGLLLFGFKTKEAKDLFLKLILVKGIGPKTAIGILAIGDISLIINAVETKNVAYLKKIPGIGPKAAQQIILDLQGKFNGIQGAVLIQNSELDEAGEVLIALGYKKNEVDKVIGVLSKEQNDTNGYVKKALSLLVK